MLRCDAKAKWERPVQKSVFLILYDAPLKDDAVSDLRKAYPSPRLYEHSRSVFLVETDDLSSAVKLKAKVQDGDYTGALFKLTKTYAGYTDRTLWEWMAKTELVRGSDQ